MGSISSKLAVDHWNATPLYVSEEERYSLYPWLSEAAEFRHHVDDRVLEIGCGTGCDLLQFAKHRAKPVGLDITPEHLRLARHRVGELAQLCYADATMIPFEDASFDYVYSHGVLHHCDRPRQIVEEIFRVLRPRGRFNIHVYAKFSYVPLAQLLKHGRNWKLWIENSRNPVHIDLYTSKLLRQLLTPARVEVKKYECKYAPFLERYVGWYLVAKGEKPTFDACPRR
jgi:ubiquinone/menaquinone biosynthesis C-methylase UbiE